MKGSVQWTVCIIVVLANSHGLTAQNTGCTTPDRFSGQCVFLDNCPLIKRILQQAPKPLPANVVNYIRSLACGSANGKTLLCCREPTQTGGRGDVANVPTTPTDVSAHRNLGLLPSGTCGPISTNKLSGGEKTSVGEFPWMALLRYRTSQYLCGGSIISQRYILTAAHCVSRLPSTTSFYSIVLGEHNTATDPDCQDGLCSPSTREVFFDRVIAHPSYNTPRFANDIAVVRLSEDLTFNEDHIKPVCLPITWTLQTQSLKSLVVAGWGTTETQAPSQELLKARLSVASLDECRDVHRTVQFSDNQICAKGPGIVDTCKGDSGGPLFFPFSLNGTKYIQFGIVSAGAPGCGAGDSKPGIYVRVQNYVHWILDNLEN